MDNKKIIIILVVVVLVVVLIALLVNRKGGNTPTTPGGTYEPGEVDTKNWDDDDYVPAIPENYTQVDQDKVVSETEAYAEAVAYYYDSGEKVTKVNVYLQNRGLAPLSKDAVCVVALKEEGSDFEYIFGGVIENGTDIEVGGRSVVRTQFIEKTGPIVSAKISLEYPKDANATAPIENPEDYEEYINLEEEKEEIVEPEITAEVE